MALAPLLFLLGALEDFLRLACLATRDPPAHSCRRTKLCVAPHNMCAQSMCFRASSPARAVCTARQKLSDLARHLRVNRIVALQQRSHLDRLRRPAVWRRKAHPFADG